MTANVGRCRLNEDIVVERELARPVRKTIWDLTQRKGSYREVLYRPILQPISLLPEHKLVPAAENKMRGHELLFPAACRRP